MDNIDYKQDLEYLYSKLIKHPLFCINQEELSKFESLYRTAIDKQNGFTDFIDAMTLLTAFFKDGHTNIELPYTLKDKCLNISCHWCGNNLLLSQNYEDIESGSAILSIENRTIKDIIALMSNRIPHENIYLVKSRMINYPYKNYHIFSEMNLKALFGNKDSFEICFSSKEKPIKKNCVLKNYNTFLDFKDNDAFISYEITDETAILHLNSCICNETYKAVLNELADICDKKKIKTLILDLSKNMGSSSAVIDEFIKYVNIDEYKRYEMIDYTQGKAKYITRRTDIVKNSKSAKRFHTDIYCRVSHDTFSSARTFAVTLADNGIAKIIGTPTGGKPNSFGMPQKYKTPNNNIAFRVSRALFLRPDSAGDNAVSLFPTV